MNSLSDAGEALLELIPDAVLYVDLEGRIRTWSGGAERMYGWTAEEAIGRRLDELMVGECERGDLATALRPPATGYLDVEGPRLRKDGSTFWVQVRVRLMHDADGNPAGVLGVSRDITALHNVREQEREAQRCALDRARLVSLDGRVNEIEIVKRPDGTIVHGNDRALQAYGYTREEFETLNVRDLREESTRAALADQLALAATDGARYETVHRRKDGSLFPVEASVRWFEVAGERYLHGLIRDLTEERRRDADRREIEGRLVSTIAAMAEGVVLQDATGRITACNPAAERILGLTREQMEGRTSVDPRWQSVHEDGRPFPGETHPGMVTLRTGKPQRGVIMGVRLPDGSQNWISISSEPLCAAPGEPPYAVVATFADVTALRRNQEAVRCSERKLAAVIEGSDDGFFDATLPEGRVEYSPSLRRMLGVKAESFPPTVATYMERIHPEDRPTAERNMREQVALRLERVDFTHRLRHEDGSWRWVQMRCAIVGTDGDQVRIAGTLRDITERVEREQRLETLLDSNTALIEELRRALAQVKTLSGLLPICMHCKRIRDDAGYWKQVEEYIGSRTPAQFSHGLCPECLEKHYSVLGEEPPVPGGGSR